jgi:hypothetical protein
MGNGMHGLMVGEKMKMVYRVKELNNHYVVYIYIVIE